MPWFVLLAATLAQATPIENGTISVNDLRWGTVHDTVMGGRSSGNWEQTESGIRFRGVLSLENNGGFASLWARSASLDLGDTDGLTLELVGDGRSWWVTAERSDVALRAGSYRASVQTRAGEVTSHTLRWSDFTPTSFGRPVSGKPSLQSAPERIVQLGWMVADGQEGAFDLEIRSIAAVASAGGAPKGTEPGFDKAIQSTFAAAIRLGVPAFNGGDAGRCRAHYQTAIESVLLLSPGGISDSQKALLQAALLESARQGDVDAAWTLRRAMDLVMRAGSGEPSSL
jgi:hypothetical protein